MLNKKQVINNLSIVLDKKITFMRIEEVKNELNTWIKEPIKYKEAWCAAYPKKMKELSELDKIRKKAIYNFVLWKRNDITTDMLVKYKGIDFKIISIIDKDPYMEITCEGDIK